MELLLTGSSKFTERQLRYLSRLGYQITLLKDERNPEGIDLSKFEAVVCNNLFLHTDISHYKALKFVQLISAGTDQVPIEYLLKKGIRLETARGIYSIPIAEWVVLKILEIYKKSRHFYDNQHIHKWEKERDLNELAGKSAAIIGYGSIGVEIAKRLMAFDVITTAVDICQPPPEELKWVRKLQSANNLDAVISQCDIVVLTLPLTEHTHHLMNEKRLKKMKPNAILVNVSRGKIIDEQALIASLQQEKFAGVALDVFDNEPLALDNPLWDFENVLITPHNAFVSNKNHKRLFDLISNNLSAYAKIHQREILANIS